MKIVLTGGGTGGHFYPLIAVAEAIEDLTKERRLIEPKLVYVGPKPFDELALVEHDIEYAAAPAGKPRSASGWPNPLGALKTAVGVLSSIFQLFTMYPDVVFSTGGFASFPTLFAARILSIPVVIYDADAKPGKVSLWSAAFARWIAVAHPDAAAHYPGKVRDRIAHVGHPIRKEIEAPASEGGHEFLNLDPSVPTVFIMGGSQGAVAINETVIDALSDLVSHYNVVHQTGKANLDETARIAGVVLKDSQYAERYRPFGLLNTLAIRMVAGIASVVVARAGSGTIFEVASWGLPAILIPIPLDISHDQTENAFTYARAGAAVVIEQRNLTPHILSAEIDRLIGEPALRATMSEAAKAYAKPAAARKIATVLVEIAVAHEPV
jgi:UDP-N-acetylglucosamine--N-acetylmuramyl-(pentapeptide) pyrophosphoryl-undecaprenol N-acetylglucosamine transferase